MKKEQTIKGICWREWNSTNSPLRRMGAGRKRFGMRNWSDCGIRVAANSFVWWKNLFTLCCPLSIVLLRWQLSEGSLLSLFATFIFLVGGKKSRNEISFAFFLSMSLCSFICCCCCCCKHSKSCQTKTQWKDKSVLSSSLAQFGLP